MRLFFKHLKKSIRRKPLQPVVLVITLAIAIGVCIMSFGLNSCFADEKVMSDSAQYGSSDITVSLNGTSKSRFMFTDDVQRVLGDRALVAGTYELPMMCGEDSGVYFSVAVDFYEIENIFDFSFIEYGEVNSSELSEIAFVSSNFAKENALSVGDAFVSEMLGNKKSYTVAAISDTRYLSSYDVMVDIGGVMEILAKDSLFVSALGDCFRPCNTVYVDVKDEADILECKELLSNDGNYSDKSVFVLSDNLGSESDMETMQILVNIARSFACILSVAVTFCCFYILASERSEENESFRIAGARALHLNLLQYAEILLYWFIGGALGIGVAVFLLKLTVYYADFQYSDGAIDFYDVLFGLLMMLGVCLATATAFIISRGATRKSRERKGKIIPSVCFFAVTALLYAITFALPVSESFIPALLGMVSVFILSFVLASPILQFIMRCVDWAFEKRFKKTGKLKFHSLRYAVKNIFSVKVLHNFACLISLLVAVLLSCFLVIVSADGYVLTAKEMIQADYVVLNSAESCYDKLVSSDAIESVSKSFFGSARIEDGRYTPAISVNNPAMLSDLLGVSELPSGNEAVFSIGQAKANGINIGDSVEVGIDGQICEMVVSEITDCGINVIVFDCTYFGIANNMLLVDGKNDVTKEELLLEISEDTALEVAAVITPESLMRQRLGSIQVYLDTGDILLTVAVIFAAIGIIDNLTQSYRERRGEFELYGLAGMSDGSVRKMKFFEVLISLGFGVFLGAMTFATASLVIERGLLAYGYEVFNAIAMLFK